MSLFFTRSVGATAQQLLSERLTERTGVVGKVRIKDARSNSAWWASGRLRADLISTMPIDVFKRFDGTQVEQVKPPVLITPEGSNSLMTDWMYCTTVDLDDVGNTVGIIRAFDGAGRPAVIELQPIDEVVVRRDRKGVVTYKIGGTTYQQHEVWHERQFPISGSPVGLSPLAHAAMSLNTAMSAQRFAVEWFGNSAVPASHLKNVDKTVSPKEARVVKDRFKAAVSNGDVFVTGKDWEYHMLAAKENEQTWVGSQELSSADIARFRGVPGDMIDVATKGSSVTYANITQRNLQLFIINVGPAVYRREQAFSARLLPQPRYAKLNTGALLRMDLAGRYEAYKTAIGARFLTPNHARELEDWPRLTPEDEAEFARLFPTNSNPQRANSGGQ
ncbi:phage portal protein [Oryzobacter sp. R7]|uniref:phage portal protein n=1 Tax=Oryzobacter faecalis TaxID=3388656 RepID=UPI00398C8B90